MHHFKSSITIKKKKKDTFFFYLSQDKIQNMAPVWVSDEMVLYLNFHGWRPCFRC